MNPVEPPEQGTFWISGEEPAPAAAAREPAPRPIAPDRPATAHVQTPSSHAPFPAPDAVAQNTGMNAIEAVMPSVETATRAIYFEQPLNERMRNFLRLDFLYQQAVQHASRSPTT